ncbi:MAG: hypothetical protein HN578_13750, partial [Rhodospirillales bacterium]|nr:hypothetical protein [Rhodospirillales bacterium]
PHMSGGDLLQTVHQRFPSVRTFILSGQCQQSEALNLVKSHDHFLRKPFNSKDLVKLLKLDERRKNQTDLIVAPELPASAEVEGRDEQKEKASIDLPDWEENPLAPARGIVFGVLFSIPLWIAILILVQWLFIGDHG